MNLDLKLWSRSVKVLRAGLLRYKNQLVMTRPFQLVKFNRVRPPLLHNYPSEGAGRGPLIIARGCFSEKKSVPNGIICTFVP